MQNALRQLASDSYDSEVGTSAPPPTQSTPSPVQINIEAPANSSGSFESNPYPEDAPPWSQQRENYSATSLPRSMSRPMSRPMSPITPSPHPSNFSIFTPNRIISPIAPFPASRHRLAPAGQLIRDSSSEPSVEWFEQNVTYGPNHPYFDMTPQQRRAYWGDLSSYFNSTQEIGSTSDGASLRPSRQGYIPRNEWPGGQASSSTPSVHRQRQQLDPTSAPQPHVVPNSQRDLGTSYLDILSPEARRLVNEDWSPSPRTVIRRTQEDRGSTQETHSSPLIPPPPTAAPTPATASVLPETEANKKHSTGFLLKRLRCRPGTATPLYTPIPGSDKPLATPAAPQKYSMAYLRRKMQRNPQKPKIEETHHNTTTDPQRSPNKRDTASPPPPPPSATPLARHYQPAPSIETYPNNNKNNDDDNSIPTCLTGPPVRLSSMIQRAPASIRSNDNIRSRPGTYRRAATLPYPSHSNTEIDTYHTNNARLSEVHLRSDTARAIREAMLDPDMEERMAHAAAAVPRRRERYGGWGRDVSVERGQGSGSGGGGLMGCDIVRVNPR